MVTNAFETLVEAGYQPEIAYFEVLHELKLIVDMIQRYGINGMWRRVSETARYGGLTRGPMVMDAANKENMKKVLTMIQDGTFNNEWISEYQKNGKDAFDKYMKEYDEHQIEKVGKEMRKMMWPDSTEILRLIGSITVGNGVGPNTSSMNFSIFFVNFWNNSSTNYL